MSVASILFGLTILVVVALYVLRPLLAPPPRPARRPPRSQAQLLAQKEAILGQIRELDFDHQTGKLPDDIYEEQRAHLLPLAAGVLQELDNVANGSGPSADIEAAVARLRQARRAPAAPAVPGRPARFCPQCGQPVDSGDNFCVACGHDLRVTPGARQAS